MRVDAHFIRSVRRSLRSLGKTISSFRLPECTACMSSRLFRHDFRGDDLDILQRSVSTVFLLGSNFIHDFHT